jgi:hypothetical protein
MTAYKFRLHRKRARVTQRRKKAKAKAARKTGRRR